MQKGNLKSDQKTRNDTLNVLYHLNGKNSSYKLNQTIRTFKTQKPQVKSSRMDSTTFKKQSKSIESQSRRNGHSHKSVRKVSAQTFSKNIQFSLQSRLKCITNIFSTPSSQTKKEIEELLLQTHNKFDDFSYFLEERKLKMIHDEIDCLLDDVISNFQFIIGNLVQRFMEEQQRKFLDMKLALEKISVSYEQEIHKLKRKNQKLMNDLGGQIQELMTRSLITTQSINYIHRSGFMNFEDWVRSALGIEVHHQNQAMEDSQRHNKRRQQQMKIQIKEDRSK